jgi:hypothetical protein
VAGIELTEHGDVAAAWPELPPDPSVIFDNAIRFNDLRGMGDLAIVLSPLYLQDTNTITRNLGAAASEGSQIGPGPIGPNK